MGRPLLDIDADEVFRLAEMQCTNEEIAYFFDCSVDTIETRFSGAIKRGRAMGVQSMKRKLFEKVQIGDLGAIVWWSKNFAGMSDKIEQKQQIESRQVVEYVTDWAQPAREIDEAIAEALPAPQKTDGDPSGSKPI